MKKERKEIYLKLSLSENQNKAIQQYAELMETTKAGSIMHMIDLCSFIGDVGNQIIPAINSIENRPEFQTFITSDDKQELLIRYYKLKSELVKLSILNSKWEPVNKIDWDVNKIK
jgi:hypothetical protein